MVCLLERLLGRYVATVVFSDFSDLVMKLRGLGVGDSVFRVVVYPEGSDAVLILYLLGDRVRVMGYREGEGLVEADVSLLGRGGYAEVFVESREQFLIDEEVIRHAMVVEGKTGIVKEFTLEELAGTVGESGDLGFRDLLRDFGNKLVIDNRLSRLLSYPSTTAKILLSATLDELDNIGCDNVRDIIREYFSSREGVAIKFQAGPYVAWIVKCRSRVGLALFEGSRLRLAGSEIIEKLDKVEEFVSRVLRKYGSATVMVYLIPRKLMAECEEYIRKHRA